MNETSALEPRRFAAVWERVNAGQAPNADSSELLVQLIESAHVREMLYKSASRSLPYFTKQLKNLSSRENHAISALQTEYFLLTGDTYPLIRSETKQTPPLLALRSCFMSENQSRCALESASRRCDNRQSKLFSLLAKEASENADAVIGIISRILS